MKRAIVVGLALLAFIAAPAAAQQPLEYKVTVQGEIVKGSAADHFLTFSAPFQLPDVTLPAGTYVFTVVAPSIVRVSSPDRAHYYAMFFTAPIPQEEATGEYEMVFARTIDTAPQRVTKWFLPYRTSGFEFLYPKAEAATER
jgi:hypothetical protein